MNRLTFVSLVLMLSGCANLLQKDTRAPEAGGFDGGGYPVEVCDGAYVGRAAMCIINGAGARQVLRANLIAGGRLYVGGSLVIDPSGRVEAAGCLPTDAPDAIVVDCPGALVSAGLLNLHEHIDYSYQQPPQAPALKWQHRHEWRRMSAADRGFEGDTPSDRVAQTEVSERAMLRHAISGTTSLSGAKGFRAFLRNLRLNDGPLAMPIGVPLVDSTFPLNDGASMSVLSAPCTTEQIAAVRFDLTQPYIPHVGEGSNAGARFEVDCVLDAITAKATPNAFIHGVAIGPEQVARLKRQAVAVVLSPRSNLQLYGVTAPVVALKDAGVTLAIGTDWSPSGSLTLLDEARCLARHNRESLQGRLNAADIHRMMTADGARAVGLQGHVGALSPGEWGDLVILDTEGRLSLAEVIEASALPQTIAVWIGGRIASAPAAWAGRLPQLENCSVDPRHLCGSARLVCGANAERPLAKLLQQTVYRIDDARLCKPQSTDDCVVR